MSDALPPPHPAVGDISADELLAEAERRARRLLGRTPMAVGATLVAGWPALLQAAAEVLDPHDTHRHLGESYQATRPDPVRGAAAVVDRMAFEAAAIGGPAVPTITHPASGPDHQRMATGRGAAATAEAPRIAAAPDSDRPDFRRHNGGTAGPQHAHGGRPRHPGQPSRQPAPSATGASRSRAVPTDGTTTRAAEHPRSAGVDQPRRAPQETPWRSTRRRRRRRTAQSPP